MNLQLQRTKRTSLLKNYKVRYVRRLDKGKILANYVFDTFLFNIVNKDVMKI